MPPNVWDRINDHLNNHNFYQQEFESHKLLLSISSPVFATMFYGGLPEIQMPIKIVDVQPEAFKSMLEWVRCYADSPPQPNNNYQIYPNQ